MDLHRATLKCHEAYEHSYTKDEFMNLCEDSGVPRTLAEYYWDNLKQNDDD